MRTALKMSVMAIAVVAALGTSAATAGAHEKKKDDDKQINICGNVDQSAFAFDDAYLADVRQEAEGPVFCQNGEHNTAINDESETSLVYYGVLDGIL
ncbi:hypothetical protein ABT112_01900 [Streptomyces sp. NPDC002055]|uniref:hypothetical protein n=1 Tax=Streptomyces sp. NPDC002055 TaxID=3154534 RepID=UPI00331F4391